MEFRNGYAATIFDSQFVTTKTEEKRLIDRAYPIGKEPFK